MPGQIVRKAFGLCALVRRIRTRMTNRHMFGRSLLLLFVVLCGSAFLPRCEAQRVARFSGTVVDEQGSGISHAEIAGAASEILGVTADDGSFSFENESQAAITV